MGTGLFNWPPTNICLTLIPTRNWESFYEPLTRDTFSVPSPHGFPLFRNLLSSLSLPSLFLFSNPMMACQGALCIKA